MSLLPVPLSTWQKDLKLNGSTTAARQLIDEYFSFFGAPAAKEELWLLTSSTLTHPELEQTKSADYRADLLFYYEFTRLFIDAVALLHSNKEIK